MSETLAYIDSYFGGELTSEEKLAFEKRCLDDQGFAEEVAFYVATRDVLKREIVKQRKEQFAKLYYDVAPVQKKLRRIVKLTPYVTAAAACLLAFFAWMLFFKPADPQKLASDYIGKNLSTLSVTMGAARDSLQTAIGEYNNKNYTEAEKVFKKLSGNSELAPDAIKYLGVLYLNTERYDEAIVQFDNLAKYGTLYANPALFYKAVVLMKRSAPGDREAAKDLLNEVVKKDLSGSKQAREWLKKL